MSKINPPSFYEKEQEFTSYTLENDIDDVLKQMRSIEDRNIKIEKIIVKAQAKLEKISKSEAIPYTVAGGYFERQNDMLSVEYVIVRLNQWIEANDKKWEGLEQRLEDLYVKLNNIQ